MAKKKIIQAENIPYTEKKRYFFLLIVKPLSNKMNKIEKAYYFKRITLIYPTPYSTNISFKHLKL